MISLALAKPFLSTGPCPAAIGAGLLAVWCLWLNLVAMVSLWSLSFCTHWWCLGLYPAATFTVLMFGTGEILFRR